MVVEREEVRVGATRREEGAHLRLSANFRTATVSGSSAPVRVRLPRLLILSGKLRLRSTLFAFDLLRASNPSGFMEKRRWTAPFERILVISGSTPLPAPEQSSSAR